MNNKIKSFFSIALIGILSLSILAIAVPVMADTCSLSIGVQSDSSYTKDESFEVRGWIINDENRRVDYTMNLNLDGPNGDGIVNILDVRLLMNHVSHPGYPVNSWVGDVTGNGVIDNDDVQLLVMHVFDSDAHLLKCGCD